MKISKYLNVYNLILLVAITVGFGVRFINLGYDSIRLDESQSIWQASHSIPYIIDYMSKNVHLPMYNIILHYYIKLFGYSEQTLRLTAAIPGFISILFFYLFVKESFNKKTALIALIFAALSPIWVWYSREIRMYGFLLMFTTASQYFFARYLNTNKKLPLVFYTTVNIFGMYTHYFYVLNLIPQAIYFLFAYKEKNKKKQLIELIISAVTVLAALVPWLLVLSNSTGVGKFGPSLLQPNGANIVATFFEFLIGYQPVYYSQNISAFWPLAMILMLLLIKNRTNKYFSYIVIATFLPVFILYFGSLIYKPMYLTRYLIVIIPSYIALLAYVISLLSKNIRVVTVLASVLFLTIFLRVQQLDSNNPYKENYKQAISYIQNNSNSRDVVAVAPAYTIYPVSYYYNSNTTLTTLPIWDKKKGGIPQLTTEALNSDIQELKDGNARLYFLATTNLEDSIEIKEYLDSNFTKLEKRFFSENIQLNVYKLEYKELSDTTTTN